MLSIQQFKATRTRATEAAFEGAFASRMKAAKVYSRHMSDAIPGLPDRYVRGGMWIEFKSLFRKRGEFTWGEGLSPEQMRTMTDISDAGDRVFYCALLDTGSGPKNFVFRSWRAVSGFMGHLIVPAQMLIYDRDSMDATIYAELRRDV